MATRFSTDNMATTLCQYAAALIIYKGLLLLKAYIQTKQDPEGQKPSQDIYTPELQELPPPLLRLSIEIIQYIASLLPPSSASALAFSSRRLKDIIGTGYWEQCNAQLCKKEKLILLELLSRDSEDEINCHRCCLLHTVAPRPILKRPCTTPDFAKKSWISSDGVQFIYLQMAMKLHRQGGDPSPYLRLLTRAVPHKPVIKDLSIYSRKSTAWTFYTARIVDDEILVRSQYCVALSKTYFWNKARLMHELWNRRLDLGPFQVCGQICLNEWPLQGRLLCLCSHAVSNSPPCLDCRGVSKCGYCGAEFQVALQDYKDNGFVLIVTAWASFGDARSPFEGRWRRHFALCDRPIQAVLAADRVMGQFEGRGSWEYMPALSKEQEMRVFEIKEGPQGSP